jgi:hypothetical protein
MSKKHKMLDWETPEQSYIIFNQHAHVFIGLIDGWPNFSNNIEDAKPLKGQEKFQTLKRYSKMDLEQEFID